MGKKFMRRLLVLLAAMCLMVTMAVPVLAEEDGESSTVTGTTEDPANGILQVMLAYVDDGGNRTYYTGGTCFLINEEYVVTNKHVFDLDTVLSNGLTVRETMKNDYSLEALPQDNDSHIRLYVFANRDTNVEATVHENAQSDVLDFAALKLSEKIYGRQPLVLGDSDSINPQDTVFAMGFPEDSVQNKKFNTKEDVSISDGIISKVTVTGSVDIIEHTAPLNNGNSGGPLLNADNQVIGINEFIIDQKNYSIQINAVKEILDTYGIAYSTAGGGTDITPDDGEDDAVEPEGPDQALISSLQSEIDKAKAMDVSGYTDESVQVLNDTIGSAESVVSNPDATDEQLEASISDLQAAVTGLEEKSGLNPLVIVGIVAAVIVIIVIIIIIVAVNSSKKKKAAKTGSAGVSSIPAGAAPVPPSGQQNTVPSPAGYQGMGADDGAGETTLLDAGAGETTLLSGAAGGAYLIRKKNGEKIAITSQNFAIGKERRRVNYCISDNTSVSRYHAVITKKGSDYYVADQKSSNFTFVNGVQLSPYQETLLTDKSILKLSDEEFEFHLS